MHHIHLFNESQNSYIISCLVLQVNWIFQFVAKQEILFDMFDGPAEFAVTICISESPQSPDFCCSTVWHHLCRDTGLKNVSESTTMNSVGIIAQWYCGILVLAHWCKLTLSSDCIMLSSVDFHCWGNIVLDWFKYCLKNSGFPSCSFLPIGHWFSTIPFLHNPGYFSHPYWRHPRLMALLSTPFWSAIPLFWCLLDKGH